MKRLLATDRNLAVAASFRLTTLETFILGAVLTVVEGIQLNVSMSSHTHDALTMVVLVIGAVVKPVSAADFVAKLPPGLVTIIQAVLGAVVVAASSWALPMAVLTIIGVVVVAASTLGLGPTGVREPVVPPAPAPRSVRR